LALNHTLLQIDNLLVFIIHFNKSLTNKEADVSDQNWIESIFSKEKEVNTSWNNWAEADFRSSQELAEIAHNGTFQEEFQKRTLFTLLTPCPKLVPFNWPNPNISHYLSYQVDFKQVSPDLRARAIDWLIKFIDFAKEERIEGLQMDPELQTEVLDAYNNYIIQLLGVLPVEDNQAETLYSYLSLNDPATWASDIEGSGYNPLLKLWRNEAVNEKWKKWADEQMRAIIRSELRGDSPPRLPRKDALKCYVRHLQSLLNPEGRLSYSRELFVDQVDFLVSLETSNRKLIAPRQVVDILSYLDKDKNFPNTEYRGRWYRFVRFLVLRDNSFMIFNQQTEKAAELMLKFCDSQIKNEIAPQLNSYQAVVQEREKQKQEKRQRDELLLKPMRKQSNLMPAESQSER